MSRVLFLWARCYLSALDCINLHVLAVGFAFCVMPLVLVTLTSLFAFSFDLAFSVLHSVRLACFVLLCILPRAGCVG